MEWFSDFLPRKSFCFDNYQNRLRVTPLCLGFQRALPWVCQFYKDPLYVNVAHMGTCQGQFSNDKVSVLHLILTHITSVKRGPRRSGWKGGTHDSTVQIGPCPKCLCLPWPASANELVSILAQHGSLWLLTLQGFWNTVENGLFLGSFHPSSQ
jgi:hypothetical protein